MGCKECCGEGQGQLEMNVTKDVHNPENYVLRMIETRYGMKGALIRTQHVAGDVVHPGDVSVDKLSEVLG